MELEKVTEAALHLLVCDKSQQNDTDADEDDLSPDCRRKINDFLNQHEITAANISIRVTTIRPERPQYPDPRAPPSEYEERAEDVLQPRPDPESANRRLGFVLLEKHNLTCRIEYDSDSESEQLGPRSSLSDPWAWDRAAFYTPLPGPPAPLHIRLLSLYWSEKQGPVICSIDTFELDSAPPFAALSYSWGKDPGEPYWIYCDGQRIPVRVNLFRALNSLSEPPMLIIRQENHPLKKSEFHGPETCLEPETNYRIRRLWVDALCINQEDNVEKPAQVQEMGRIYSKAARVISWVVPDVDFTMDGFKLFDWGKRAYLGIFNETVHLEEDCEKVHGVPTHDNPGWREIKAFFRNEYFERSWVVQEVALAKKAVLVLDRLEIDWHLVGGVAGVFEEMKMWQTKDKQCPYRLPLKKNPFENARKLRSLYVHPDKTHDMLNLLVHLREWKCGDPVDKVYSLFGITNSPIRTAKYGINKYELFRETARALIQQRQNLDVMSFVPQTQFHWGPYGDFPAVEFMEDVFLEDSNGRMIFRWMEEPGQPDRSVVFTEREDYADGVPPSWAPAWDLSDPGPQNASLLNEKYGYAASSSEPPTISVLQNDSLLSASGLRLGTIEICSDVIGNFADFYITNKDPIDTVKCFSSVLGSDYPSKHSAEAFNKRWDFALAIVAGYPTVDLSPTLNVSTRNMVRTYWEATLETPFLDPKEMPEGEDEVPAAETSTHAGAVPSVIPNDFIQWFNKNKISTTIGNHRLVRLPGELKDSDNECNGCRVAGSYCARLCKMAYHRRVFYIKSGHFGLGPANMKVGDQVVVLFGGKVLFVLRRKHDYYRLIGDCYLHKAMNGEVIEEWKQGQRKSEVFNIL
ncbi:heterokaryon incompatibility [Fusarium beomiforme]|uniref:Heterokaryon incompatibility n=1 Tax=Fusarium beomiforme TaxID=44412 RepID=A0A9P5ABR6_9HYPO|nr:heterokaryon incompatibility [Fusarium beomiforme]